MNQRLMASVVAVSTGFFAACSSEPEQPSLEAGFGAYGLATAVDGLSFYPPFVPAASPSGNLDSRAHQFVTVRLESSTDGVSFSTTVASFDRTTSPRLNLQTVHGVYSSNLRAADFFTNPALSYRFRVIAPSRDLGTVDVPSQIFGFIQRYPELNVSFRLHISSAAIDGDNDGNFDWNDTCPEGPVCTCDDGVRNQGETEIDCGGAFCGPCETCDDGERNQGETGVDCGGPCASCVCPDGTVETYYLDADGDGFGDEAHPIQACSVPAGFAPGGGTCTNGSVVDCNISGTTLIPTSRFVDNNVLLGWVQCAGFINTSGNDVAHNFLDNCLNTSALRIRVYNAAGALEEDIEVTGQSSWGAWPNWNYLGGTMTAHQRTYWGFTNFFTTTTGNDACNQSSAPSGTTFGTGNGGVAIVAGGNTNESEYRISCGGSSLPDRRIAIFRAGQSIAPFDCNDMNPAVRPGADESCNGVDDNCLSGVDEGNPGSGAACNTGLLGICATGATTCSNGALACNQTIAPASESCNGLDDDCDGSTDESGRLFHRDADGDGYGNELISVDACSAPPGYVDATSACSNGSFTDCNVAGTTLNPSSVYVDSNPLPGWIQCAGFVNTSGNDVAHNFLDNCLNTSALRIRVYTALGQVEEDIEVTGQSLWSSWPNWNYLGGTVTAHQRTYWGFTSFFTTTTGNDACNQSSAPSGTTFGTGNGGVGIIAGGNTNGAEYRISCGGSNLLDRRIAIFKSGNGPAGYDCNDGAATAHPGASEACNGHDDDCDGTIDDGNPGSGATCATGLQGACASGTTSCSGGALICNATGATTESCNGIDDDCDGLTDESGRTYYRDADGDGFGSSSNTTSACSAPPGYVAGGNACSNGSINDCNVTGTTLIASSAYLDPNPLSGWVQCAGFINTSGNDVAHNFLDNCLNATALRLRVYTSAGTLEEDITVTGMTSWSAWPNWNYLGGTLTADVRTYWGFTSYFTTTTGNDACNQSTAPSGTTFGTGNGGVAIIAGGNTGDNEYRISCGGSSLANRRVAIFRSGAGATAFDCNDANGTISPGAAESCNGVDDDCDNTIDDGNPGAGASCTSGQAGICSAGTTSCSGGALVCNATNTPQPEACNGLDDDCDGAVDDACFSSTCTNGSGTDCNPAGTTLRAGSAYIDPATPAGWNQCAGFINTSSDDVAHNFLNNCLNTNRLRIRVFTAAGALEEDIEVTGMTVWSSWPNWNYLGGTLNARTRTYWGFTSFFTTTNGADACNQSAAPSGTTFGTGNGGVAIVAGGNTGANEYRISCGGTNLVDRRIAIYR